MARTVCEKEHAARRSAILDAAQELMYTKGYEQMTIQDILDALGISKGALYHYFPSKHALLEALVDRIADQIMGLLRGIVADTHMGAAPKLQAVFRTSANWKSERIELLAPYVETWLADENAVVREMLGRASMNEFAQMLERIVEQGISEGVMSSDYPEMAGKIVIALMQSMSSDIVRIVTTWGDMDDPVAVAGRSIAAHTDAIERVLTMASGSLHLIDPEVMRLWGDRLSRS